MLYQSALILHPERPCAPRSDWGYRLYASLLEQAPEGFGTEVHRDAVTPVSQYLQIQPDGSLRWTVSLLGAPSRAALEPVLSQSDQFYLRHDHLALQVTGRTMESVECADQLLSLPEDSRDHILEFKTPTCFKRQGQYLPLPDPRLILQSQIKKWNGCFPDCPIEDEGQGLEALAAGLQIRSFQICSRNYSLKGHPIPGFVGSLTLQNRLDGFHRILADALLEFSAYAGTGIKTSLGMGGTFHHR